MGQAKQKGSYEQRVALAIDRDIKERQEREIQLSRSPRKPVGHTTEEIPPKDRYAFDSRGMSKSQKMVILAALALACK